MLYHHVAHGRGWSLLFHDHHEAAELWRRLVAGVPTLVAACLMPDHFHLLTRRAVVMELGRVLSAFGRVRNHRRGERGPVFAPPPAPERVAAGKKAARLTRYIDLNPCRGGLASDPLAWPWSTYRDRMGLVLSPVVKRTTDPHELHRYTSSDPSVAVNGSLLPVANQVEPRGPAGFQLLVGAVSAATRTPIDTVLGRRGPARSLLMRAVRCSACLPDGELADALGLSLRAVQRVPSVADSGVRLALRLAGDERFPGIHGADLRRDPAVQRYRSRRR